MTDEPKFERMPEITEEGALRYALWLEQQPFDVIHEDGSVTHYEPKTISDLVAEGVTEYEVEG